MTPVDQTAFGPAHGNCLAACLASLLDRPLEELPEFKPARLDALGRSRRLQVDVWLGTRGMGLLTAPAGAAVVRPYGMHYIAIGHAPHPPSINRASAPSAVPYGTSFPPCGVPGVSPLSDVIGGVSRLGPYDPRFASMG